MSDEIQFSQDDLIHFSPKHDSFVGIDSDGCVVDTMEIKQKECFHSIIISHWHLHPIEAYVRETAEFTNLYSKWRGTNRFIALIKMFDLLSERKEVIASGLTIPRFDEMRQFIDSGIALGNPSLEEAAAETGSEELTSFLQWSKAVNIRIADVVQNVPTFQHVHESLQKVHAHSDAICVSQTPVEALVREWQEHDLMPYVSIIAGQELGTKTEHIAMATTGRYTPDKILMVGDAPGDKRAAKENDALFYPINPAHENESWERFYEEAYDKFLAGEYAGDYEDNLIRDFETLLPETPPWL